MGSHAKRFCEHLKCWRYQNSCFSRAKFFWSKMCTNPLLCSWSCEKQEEAFFGICFQHNDTILYINKITAGVQAMRIISPSSPILLIVWASYVSNGNKLKMLNCLFIIYVSEWGNLKFKSRIKTFNIEIPGVIYNTCFNFL